MANFISKDGALLQKSEIEQQAIIFFVGEI